MCECQYFFCYFAFFVIFRQKCYIFLCIVPFSVPIFRSYFGLTIRVYHPTVQFLFSVHITLLLSEQCVWDVFDVFFQPSPFCRTSLLPGLQVNSFEVNFFSTAKKQQPSTSRECLLLLRFKFSIYMQPGIMLKNGGPSRRRRKIP